MTSPRWIALEGAFNVRDLGGLPAGPGRTQPGVLLRSDTIDNLTPADAERLTRELGLRAVVDLRNPTERPEPAAWIAAAAVLHRPIPLFDLSGETTAAVGEDLRRDIGAAYRRMLELAGPAIAQVIELLTDDTEATEATEATERTEGGAVLVHCAAGKDRTGIVTAVVLLAVGVAEDVIVADYMATAERLDAVRAALARREIYRAPTGAGPMPAMTADSIHAVLDALRDELGGVVGYLTRWGVEPGRLDRLRRLFLDPR